MLENSFSIGWVERVTMMREIYELFACGNLSYARRFQLLYEKNKINKIQIKIDK